MFTPYFNTFYHLNGLAVELAVYGLNKTDTSCLLFTCCSNGSLSHLGENWLYSVYMSDYRIFVEQIKVDIKIIGSSFR
jgi:hypothetical protein